MMYEKEIREAVLDTLENRVSSIALCIGKLLEEGYIPNNKKEIQLNWLTILIPAYEHINSFTREQQDNLDRIYNNVIRL